MAFGFADLLVCFLIFQLGFVSLFLFSLNRGKPTSNGLLGGVFAVLTLNLLDSLLLVKGFYGNYPSWAMGGTNLALLVGPLLWLHTQSVICRHFRLCWQHGLHSLPFLVLTASSLMAYHAQSPAEQRNILQAILNQQLPALFYGVSILVFSHFFTYLFLALRLLGRYKRALTNQFSAVQNKNLSWLFSTLIFFLVFFVLSLVRSAVAHSTLAAYQPVVLVVLLLVLLVFINRFLLGALRSPELFTGLTTDELTQASPLAGARLADTNQDGKTPALIHGPMLNRLADYMQTHKPYLEPEITLDQLAGRLGVRPKCCRRPSTKGWDSIFLTISIATGLRRPSGCFVSQPTLN
ncbi:hypothetical protein GO730_14725 [Spirosoma sp. HMF3257]|uniref:hypothetical protein n=1 Tax=Spirosoma telluris TaxID=2183553 RepID=UPI0011B935BA|nr:hypothetical protein [Spirosoma telluris]